MEFAPDMMLSPIEVERLRAARAQLDRARAAARRRAA
jgi:hypothetical protein